MSSEIMWSGTEANAGKMAFFLYTSGLLSPAKLHLEMTPILAH